MKYICITNILKRIEGICKEASIIPFQPIFFFFQNPPFHSFLVSKAFLSDMSVKGGGQIPCTTRKCKLFFVEKDGKCSVCCDMQEYANKFSEICCREFVKTFF